MFVKFVKILLENFCMMYAYLQAKKALKVAQSLINVWVLM